MRFEWRREGPAEACGANCRIWISAVGYITADTPREFEAFAKDPNTRGAVLVLDSDGGSVLGTLALGRSIRNLAMVTTIGKTATLPPTSDGVRRATLSPNGNCESMCAFLLLAGASRYVPPEAHVLVHQIWLGKKRKQALESNYSAEELNVVQRDIGRLAQYTIEMGGSGDCSKPPCASRRGSRCIGSLRTSFSACGSTRSTPCSIATFRALRRPSRRRPWQL